MAYRALEVTDLVRITDGGIHHGKNAQVVEPGDKVTIVDVDCTRVLVLTSKLIIRDNQYEFIRDGKLDLEAKEKWYNEKGWEMSRPVEPWTVQYGDEEELEEACGGCSCCKWHNANY